MPTTNLTQLATYLEPKVVTKVIKKRGERGLISWSAYLRALVYQDVGISTKK